MLVGVPVVEFGVVLGVDVTPYREHSPAEEPVKSGDGLRFRLLHPHAESSPKVIDHWAMSTACKLRQGSDVPLFVDIRLAATAHRAHADTYDGRLRDLPWK